MHWEQRIIDLAVLVSDQSKFDALKKYLIKKENFSLTANEYTLRDPQGYEVDLFPFGNLNIEGRKVIDKEGLVHTDVSGFQEVYEEATEEVSFENRYNFRVASLAGIVVLKLIAWDDRPEIRSDDIVDIAAIINHYFELEENLIFEQHSDLFIQDFYDLKLISARVLGREMQLILQKNELLRMRVLNILKEKKEEIQRKFLGGLVNEGIADLPDYHSAIIDAMVTGTEENKQEQS